MRSPSRKTLRLLIGAGTIAVALGVSAEDDAQHARGAYLVDVLAACAGCHTPRAPAGPALSGGNAFPGTHGTMFAANITPDRATGIGAWSDDQLVAAIRHGMRPDGSSIAPPMPQTAYGYMEEADALAIVRYLRSVPPVVHAVPRSASPPRLKAAEVASLPVGTSGDLVVRGRYIAVALSHCTECHASPSPSGASPRPSGGRAFRTAKGTIVAPGITAHDLDRFTDGELSTIVTRGIRPDGSKLEGPMPVKSYAAIKADDLAALLAFLRKD